MLYIYSLYSTHACGVVCCGVCVCGAKSNNCWTNFSKVFVPLCGEFNENIKHHHFRVLLVYHIHLESERNSALASPFNLAHVACPKMSLL